MISLRLKTLADLIPARAKVIDVGADHGLLSIYLVSNKLAQKVLATDINASALNNVKKKIEGRGLNIKIELADGLHGINLQDYDTVVISGLGGLTINKILIDSKQLSRIKQVVLQPTNKLPEVRKHMAQLGYYLANEVIIKEHNKFYVNLQYLKNHKKNPKFIQKWGLLNNQEYVQDLIERRIKILDKLHINNKKSQLLLAEIAELKEFINK